MWQVFLVVNPPTRGFLLSGEVSSDRYAAVTCTLRMKKAHYQKGKSGKKEWTGESTANGYDHQIFDLSEERK